jgi:diguanylate cyclase (GGDEF)-like protein
MRTRKDASRSYFRPTKIGCVLPSCVAATVGSFVSLWQIEHPYARRPHAFRVRGPWGAFCRADAETQHLRSIAAAEKLGQFTKCSLRSARHAQCIEPRACCAPRLDGAGVGVRPLPAGAGYVVMKTFHSRAGTQREPSQFDRLKAFPETPQRVVASGYYRATGGAEVEKTVRASLRERAPLRAWAHNLWFVLPVCQWFAHNEFVAVLLALSPLVFIVLRRGAASGYVYAGLCSVAIRGVDWLHPLPPVHAVAGSSPHALLSLVVIAFVLLRLHDEYRGLKTLSQHDPLTGLLNRRGFEELAQRELGRAARYERPIAFALVDIDRFKEINDQFGHVRGDRVLGIVGAELTCLRASDLAVRLGGDEFGLLMPETDEAAALSVVDRLKHRVEERTRAEGLPITISVGIAASEPVSVPLATLMAEADRRMYLDKSGSRRFAAGSRTWQSEDARSR